MQNKKEIFTFVTLFGLLATSLALNLIQSNKIEELVDEVIKLQQEQVALDSYTNSLHSMGGAEDDTK